MKKTNYYLTNGDYTVSKIGNQLQTSEMLYKDPTSVDCPVTFDTEQEAQQFAKDHQLTGWKVSSVTTEWDDKDDDSNVTEVE